MRVIQKLLLHRFVGPLVALFSTKSVFSVNIRRLWGNPSLLSPEDVDAMWDLLVLDGGRKVLSPITGSIRERHRFWHRWIGALRQCRLPTRVLWGTEDPVAVPEMARVHHGELPGSELTLLDGVGHYSMLGGPGTVVRCRGRLLPASWGCPVDRGIDSGPNPRQGRRMIGNRLAHFEIREKLGEGGMGEVYRAHDTRLGRDVAIKVLPEAFVSDPDRFARFEREARVLASLSHANIAGIFEVGEAEGVHYLVMELAEGETLADRLARGALPVEEALEIAGQIAEAVAAAHDHGVIHRDLKPGNVMVAPDGMVKVLDFGLAKALAPEPASASGPELAASPTLTFQPTAAGMLLGTAAYMSSEQAKGRPADRRSDVWAWGCILYEMVTGRSPFAGDSVAESLAKTLQSEPDWELLPADSPSALEPVLRRCLAKDPRERLRDVGDARLLLAREDAVETVPGERPSSPWRERLAWGVAAVAIVAALAVVWEQEREPTAETPPVTRFDITLPEDAGLALIDLPVLAFAPDSKAVAFVAHSPQLGDRALHVRSVDRAEPRALSGTEGASAPFFSPDGEWLGFFADGRLAKIPAAGGPVVGLADAPTPRGAVWFPDDTIVYSPLYAAGLWRVPAGGGASEEILEPDSAAGERTFRWPDVWPDGRSILFTVGSQDSPNDYDQASIVLWDPASGDRTTLVEGANMARFLPPDRLLYFRDGSLYAVRVDTAARRVVGSAVPVLEDVMGDPASGAAYFAVAPDGSLAFAPGTGNGEVSELVVVDREGETRALEIEPRAFNHPRFSPDGSRLAFTDAVGRGGASGDVWFWSLQEKTLGRLTFDEGGVYPVWAPDGEEIVYNSGARKIHAKPVSGAGEPRTLLDPEDGVYLPGAWSPDGRVIAFTVLGSSSADLYLMRDGEDPVLFEKDAASPAFSPDGRWLAYQSPASGLAHVFVRPVEGPGKWQISPPTAGYPRWPAKGSEIFYLAVGSAGRAIHSVPVEWTESFRFGPPGTVFEDTTAFATSTAPLVNWDVDPEGHRFVFVSPLRGELDGQKIRVALGWGRDLPLPD